MARSAPSSARSCTKSLVRDVGHEREFDPDFVAAAPTHDLTFRERAVEPRTGRDRGRGFDLADAIRDPFAIARRPYAGAPGVHRAVAEHRATAARAKIDRDGVGQRLAAVVAVEHGGRCRDRAAGRAVADL